MIITHTRGIVSLFILFVILDPMTLAQNADVIMPLDPFKAAEQQDLRRKTLEENAAEIARLNEAFNTYEAGIEEKMKTLGIDQLTDAMVEQAQSDVASTQLAQKDLQANITDAERRIDKLTASIGQLKTQRQLLANPANDEISEARRLDELNRVRLALTQQQTDLELERKQLENLRNRLELVAKRLALMEQWKSQINEVVRLKQEQDRLEAQEDFKERSKKRQQDYQDQAAELKQTLETEASSLSDFQRRLLETRIQSAEEQAKLIELDTSLTNIDGILEKWNALLSQTDIKTNEIKTGLKELYELQNELQTKSALLRDKLDVFLQQQQVIEQREGLTGPDRSTSAQEAEIVANIIATLKTHQTRMRAQLTRIEGIRTELDEYYLRSLRADLFARAQFPATTEEWEQLLSGLGRLPTILFHQSWLSIESTARAMKSPFTAKDHRWLEFIALEFGLVICLVALRRNLTRTLKSPDNHRPERKTAGDIVLIAPTLLHQNIGTIGISATLLLIALVFDVPDPAQNIVITLALLLLGVKGAIDLMWLVLVSPSQAEGSEVSGVYWQWFCVLILGGILIAILSLAHFSDLPPTTVNVLDWVIYLYLLLVMLPLSRARRFLIRLLTQQDSDFMGNLTFRFVSFLFPIALFVVAMIGIAGYLSLAGFIARYMGIFLAILLGWGIAESLLTHWSATIKNRIGSAYGANTPLIRDFVDLIHRILSVLLLLVAGFLLYRSYDWKTEYIVSNWEALLVAVLSVIIAYEVIFFLASHYIRRTRQRILQSLVQQSKKPMGVILPLAAAQIVITKTTLPGETIEFLLHALVLAQIAAISWLILSMVAVVDKYAEQRYFEDTRDKMAARRIRTQARVLRRIVAVGVYILAIAAMLMTFPTVRQLGAGLLASAGAAGLIIGIAARPLFENLIAGMQIGLAQPIRIDDHVIVENEWGRIEEINSTYVVVHIWDDRRLIVPLNYFNTQPFQNWTLTGSTLIGSVFVYVDYTFPMEEGRKELKRILDSTDLWDGNVWVLQVTDASEQTMELRALMTAKDAPTAWDLRCYVREHFIAFIQRNHPDCLPKARASVKRDKRTTGSETLGFPGIVQNG